MLGGIVMHIYTSLTYCIYTFKKHVKIFCRFMYVYLCLCVCVCVHKPYFLCTSWKKMIIMPLHPSKLPFSHARTYNPWLTLGSIDLQFIYSDKTQSFSCDKQLNKCEVCKAHFQHTHWQHRSRTIIEMERVKMIETASLQSRVLFSSTLCQFLVYSTALQKTLALLCIAFSHKIYIMQLGLTRHVIDQSSYTTKKKVLKSGCWKTKTQVKLNLF